MTLSFFDAATGGNLKCAAATVQSEAGTGRFSVTLPAECADAVHEKTDLWSEAAVGPAKTLLPRAHVGAVPYALEADAAKLAKGVQCAGCVTVGAMAFDKDVDLQGHALAGSKVTLAGAELTGPQVKTLTQGGNADALHTHSGLGGGGGGQVIKFKGVTAATTNGASGFAAMNKACKTEFGAARMCTSDQLMEMYPAVEPTAQAWVFAVMRAMVGGDTVAGSTYFFTSSSSNDASVRNCAWSPSGDSSGARQPFLSQVGYGSTILPGGGGKDEPCSKAFAIACCGP